MGRSVGRSIGGWVGGYRTNSIDPSTDPCGTPDFTGFDSDVESPTVTSHFKLPIRQKVGHDC